MEDFTSEDGRPLLMEKAKSSEKESSMYRANISTEDHFKTERGQVMAQWSGKMGQFTWDNGMMEPNKAKEDFSRPMGQLTKVIGSLERSPATENYFTRAN